MSITTAPLILRKRSRTGRRNDAGKTGRTYLVQRKSRCTAKVARRSSRSAFVGEEQRCGKDSDDRHAGFPVITGCHSNESAKDQSKVALIAKTHLLAYI